MSTLLCNSSYNFNACTPENTDVLHDIHGWKNINLSIDTGTDLSMNPMDFSSYVGTPNFDGKTKVINSNTIDPSQENLDITNVILKFQENDLLNKAGQIPIEKEKTFSGFQANNSDYSMFDDGYISDTDTVVSNLSEKSIFQGWFGNAIRKINIYNPLERGILEHQYRSVIDISNLIGNKSSYSDVTLPNDKYDKVIFQDYLLMNKYLGLPKGTSIFSGNVSDPFLYEFPTRELLILGIRSILFFNKGGMCITP